MIVITMEGGLVQSVTTDNPAVRKEDCVIIDYDAEGSDDYVTDENGDDCCPSNFPIDKLSKRQVKEVERLLKEREDLG